VTLALVQQENLSAEKKFEEKKERKNTPLPVLGNLYHT
jgi:hypothetical protein